MSTIFICGHGAWNPSDGFTVVPAKTSIAFYTKNSKWMCSSDVFELIKGTFTGAVEQECGEYKTSPNMRVFPDDPACEAYSLAIKPATVDLYFTTAPGGVTLADIFKQRPGNNFVWACCRNLGLKKAATKGASVKGHSHINLEERVDGYYDYNFTTQAYTKISSK